MLKSWMQHLSQELDIPNVPMKKNTAFFTLGTIAVSVQETDSGYFFTANVQKIPDTHQEEIYRKIMQANLIGQGTGGSVLAIDKSERWFTLSLAIGYIQNYPIFKETLEEFVNYINYWKEEIDHMVA